MNLGPRTSENNKEVNVANIALVDKNSTTRKGPKTQIDIQIKVRALQFKFISY